LLVSGLVSSRGDKGRLSGAVGDTRRHEDSLSGKQKGHCNAEFEQGCRMTLHQRAEDPGRPESPQRHGQRLPESMATPSRRRRDGELWDAGLLRASMNAPRCHGDGRHCPASLSRPPGQHPEVVHSPGSGTGVAGFANRGHQAMRYGEQNARKRKRRTTLTTSRSAGSHSGNLLPYERAAYGHLHGHFGDITWPSAAWTCRRVHRQVW